MICRARSGAAQRGSVVHDRLRVLATDLHQQDVACAELDECRDLAVAAAAKQVAFLVPRNGPIFDVGRALADRHGVTDPACRGRPTIIKYLHEPPTRERLIGLIAVAGLQVRDALRQKGTPCAALGLEDPSLADDQLLDAMLAEPILINRPCNS